MMIFVPVTCLRRLSYNVESRNNTVDRSLTPVSGTKLEHLRNAFLAKN